jgi:diguanylate cyclase (GGDEF)-like protein/putative nucleotidyltransferase with HDIG domain
MLMERLGVEVDRSRRHGRPLCVAAVDLDGFRAINGRHGRGVGDQVVVAVAQVLSRFMRTTDEVSRSAADEFLLLLPETNAEGAKQALTRLLLELEAVRVGPVETISASIGVAEWRRPMGPDELLAQAGEAMLAARARGGGRVELGSSTSDAVPAGGTHGDVIMALAEALLERDRYTGEHSESVVELASKVAEGLALGTEEVQRVRAAALLHDIGKVAIPDAVLNKQGELDESEWEVMREHPVIGERILRAIPGLGGVARMVRHEHERFDGGGYPDGLRGDEIPIGARIILACDAYHAMTSDRPYRKAMSHGEAIRELAKGAGSQFDPEVTEVLIGCLYLRPRATAPAEAPSVALAGGGLL